ncbi:MAG: PEP-utilizing enzyme [Desulfotomaculaceae bacterium]|nr:PEP-utilizing enzyme [Desulfotomaculaceae bacterium]
MSEKRKFSNPSEAPVIPGTEGWERMYPYFYQIAKVNKEREAYENNTLWYYDGLHYPEPMYPFDLIWDEAWYLSLSQFNTRIFMVPAAYGVDHRIINGYVYLAAVPVTDPKEIEKRIPLFMERAGYYYENWDSLYAKWKEKMLAIIKAVDAIEFKNPPDMEDISIIHDGIGISTAYDLSLAYNRVIELAMKNWQYHMEFLNLGYAAYVTFADFCRQAFPGIEDSSITKMIGGIDVILFQPDERVKELAKSAVNLGVAGIVKSSTDPEVVMSKMAKTDPGKEWLKQLEEARDPWFYLSSGTGWYHDHYCWNDRLEIPFMSIRSYIAKLEKGESLERPTQHLLEERERITSEYALLLRTEEDKNTFEKLLAISRTVFPYVEEHLFYVEHWFHSVFYGKIRELAAVLVNKHMINDVEDIWYLNRFEISELIADMNCAWGTGVNSYGASKWPQEIEWRKGVLQKFREYTPPPAYGLPPEVVKEPFTVVLWGVTTERVDAWLDAKNSDNDSLTELRGFSGSTGVVEGIARVVRGPSELSTLREGEILVAPTTSPSWAPIFTVIRGVVTDVGGIMSHAAIVCREYGMPAVVGAGYGTARIKTGQRIRVDGDKGIVTLLEP